MTRIGVLALQGAFEEQVDCFSRVGAEPVEVRLPDQLSSLDALVIPGGESTTIAHLMDHYGFVSPLTEMGRDGFPIWGTCAGLIVLTRQADGLHYPTLGLMDARVRRNAFGRQVDSFEADLDVPALGAAPYRAVFIRAPVLVDVGPEVRVLARLNGEAVVAAGQGNLLATAFHPELTDDLRFHRYFLSIAAAAKGRAAGVGI